jgi:hypothetical protein
MDDSILATVKGHFGARDEAAKRAYSSDESFRDLCLDYVYSLAALERWQAADSPEAVARAAEYADLAAKLAREIEARLGEEGTGPRHERKRGLNGRETGQ